MILKFRISNGKPVYDVDSYRRLEQFYSQHEGKYVYMDVSEKKPTRSLEHNAYLWGVVYKYISDYTGHTTEEIHSAMKYKFLPRSNVFMGEEAISIPKSTKTLKTDEFKRYVDQVVAFAGTELGISIPLPNES